MKKNNLNLVTKMKGFTLIELLVVITIIGILATIVIVNLNSARGRGQDAAITEQMAQVRSQLALYYSDNFGYSVAGTAYATSPALADCTTYAAGTTAFADADFKKAVAGVLKNSSVAPKCALGSNSGANSQSWVMYAKLRVNATDYWCVDSSGASTKLSNTGSFPSVVTTTNGAMVDVSCQ